MPNLTWTTEADWIAATKTNIDVVGGSFQLAPVMAAGGVEDFEDGNVDGWTTTPDPEGHGTDYFFRTQTDDVHEGGFSGEHHLRGSVGSADFTETMAANLTELSNPKVEMAFQLNAATDGNPDFESISELQIDVTLTDASTETIEYRMATIDATPSDNPTALFFVVSGHNSSTWTTFTQTINDDLSSGGYANVDSIDAFTFYINTPGTGGGTDEIHMYFDSLVIRNE